jgi:hypothetical protein
MYIIVESAGLPAVFFKRRCRMSQLIDKLKRATEGAAPALGFRTSAATSRPAPLLLVARVAGPQGVKALVAAGADALLVTAPDAGLVGEVVKAASGVPCGAILERPDRQQLAAIKEAGSDFVVFSASTSPLAVLKQEGMGKVLKVPPDPEMLGLRGLDGVGVDAVLLEGDEGQGFVSVQYLMVCRFLGDVLRKPLLAGVPPRVDGDDVATLWETGVDGLVLETDGAGLKQLRQVVNALPATGRRRKGREAALLPRLSEGVPMPMEEEEDDEDWP